MNHQNIVKFLDFFEDLDNVYIIMELCSNSTLNDQVKRRKRLSELEAKCYLLQIIHAVADLTPLNYRMYPLLLQWRREKSVARIFRILEFRDLCGN